MKEGGKRQWDTGLIRPYRRKPDNFREVYIRMGWDGIEEELQANWRCIRRWIMEEGREELQAARAAHVADQRKSRRARYVMGQTLKPVRGKKRFDAQLHPGVKNVCARDLRRDVVFDMRIENEDLSDVTEVNKPAGKGVR